MINIINEQMTQIYKCNDITEWTCIAVTNNKCREALTGVVAIGACVWPLALAEAPHGALVVVDTFFIDGIYVVLWGP